MRRCFNQSRWISLNNEYQRQRTAYRTRLDILRAAQLKRDIFGQNDQDHYQRVCRMLKGQDILPARTFINCDSPGSTVQNLVDDLFPSDHQETDTPHQALSHSVYVINNNLGALAHLMKKIKIIWPTWQKILSERAHTMLPSFEKTDRRTISTELQRVAKRPLIVTVRSTTLWHQWPLSEKGTL
ncbi:hypothetical protein DERF_011490 [Dermatophagoides farinae]|uniref:Uncharacterized protein n=1 Tax=Dermatophagoides farinae TaxID=6954 RepID=A0A922HW74_DERFA|nr:hypothetical protein DERF_011490 [Dermatophagoides farinae]